MGARQNPEVGAIGSRLHKPQERAVVGVSLKLLTLVVGKHLKHLGAAVLPRHPLAEQLGVELPVLGGYPVDAAPGGDKTQHGNSLAPGVVRRKPLKAHRVEVAEVVGHVPLPLLLWMLCRPRCQLIQRVLIVRCHDKLYAIWIWTCHHEGVGRWASMATRHTPTEADKELLNNVLAHRLVALRRYNPCHGVPMRGLQSKPCFTSSRNVALRGTTAD
mmetsp:Transcript_66434/g.197705  ORF Transcript_66434/g.197705 Transcript_66434/m.197705 type:complete len:216 (+) Transcript_66434:1306-1953(+)